MEPEVISGLITEISSEKIGIYRLFMDADWVVKSVMIGLIFSSIWCWAIIFEKIFRIRWLKRTAYEFEENFWNVSSLDDLYEQVSRAPKDPMSALFVGTMREWKRSLKGITNKKSHVHIGTLGAGLSDRLNRVINITVDREMERLERNMTFLASVGSVAPFVGLFGTVWGIMNSFQSIAIEKNTSLAVVAPGISEALFATALGLLAAIPAVLAFNKFNSDLGRYADRLQIFGSELVAFLSRKMDEYN